MKDPLQHRYVVRIEEKAVCDWHVHKPARYGWTRRQQPLRVLEWLERAAKVDVDLLVFPEAFLSGYPFWVSRTDGVRFEDTRQKKAYAA